MLAALAGCGASSSSPACRVGAECASGVCESTGTCRPLQDDASGFLPGDVTPDREVAGPDDDSVFIPGEDASEGPSDGEDVAPVSDIADDPGQACTPNHDGSVQAGEAPFPTGVTVVFRTALNAPVDLVGKTVDGTRQWDLSAPVAGDEDLAITTQPVDSQWFAPLFPDASYAARLTAQNALLGVFRRTDSALQLLGVVSPDDGTFRTELLYDPPVDLLRFPVQPGDEWTVNSTITGTAQGVPCTSFIGGCSEKYRFEVDASGTVLTPFGAFPALRVRTELDRRVGVAAEVTRSYQFVVECFGIVATLTSKTGETQIEFGTASELRRLAPWTEK